MAWRVVITDAALPDIEKLDDPQRALAEVFEWVRAGPPCEQERGVGPAVVYEETLTNGFRVHYFIGTIPHAYVAIVRVRPPIKPTP